MGRARPFWPTGYSIRDHYEWAKEFSFGLAPVVARKWEWKGEFQRHDHDFWEIQFCVGGKGVHCSIDGEQPMREGDVFIIRPGAWHAYRQCRGMAAYICCFNPRILLNELSWTLTEPRLNRLLWWQESGDGRGATALHMADRKSWERSYAHLYQLYQLGEDNVSATRVDRIGHLTMLLAELARCVPDETSHLPVANEHDKAQSHGAVQEAIRILHRGIVSDISAGELAERLHIDESYLGRLFRTALGDSPMAYLAGCRAEKAASLLLQTDLTISEIGNKVGWSDPNHFARRFRHHYGMSASAYRLCGKGSDQTKRSA